MSIQDGGEDQASIIRLSSPPIAEPEVAYGLEAGKASSEEDNPGKVFFDRMHGRWRWVVILAALLVPALGFTGYLLGPVKYSATAVLVVESKLEALVRDTPETAAIAIDNEVAEQSQLIRNPQVGFKAATDPELKKYKEVRPSFARDLISELNVSVPRNSSVILVSMFDEDPAFAADAVNAVVRAYLEVFVPSNEIAYQEKVARLNAMITSARGRISTQKRQRIDILSDSRYATIDAREISDENVESIRLIELEIDAVQATINEIEASYTLKKQQEALENGEDIATLKIGEPGLNESVPPNRESLYLVDRGLIAAEDEIDEARIAYDLVSQRFGKSHEQYRRVKANLDALESSYNSRVDAATKAFQDEFGDQMTWGALRLQRKNLLAQMVEFRDLNGQIELDRIKAEELESRIQNEEAQLAILQERLLGLEREKDSIRQGRVSFRAPAVPSVVPTSDKKLAAAVGGAAGGCAVAIGLVFLLSCFDQKVYGVRQLGSQRNDLKVLGVMPDMDETGGGDDSLNLARDCIHRIRSRIESRRENADGYSIMVSSPFQGDGKTTFSISLGWSYAESGYRTLLIDSDFIGRAMTHQFGRLRSSGLREAIRSGTIAEGITELGHPNLSLLGIGFDRRVTAANLSPRIMQRLIDQASNDYDIIIIDSGPLGASVEAMSVASASDGGILCLQKGRSRDRLRECIHDFLMVRSQYLGVVLNYASRKDCEQYGSISRMSTAVEAELHGDGVADTDSGGGHMIADLDSDKA